MSCKHNSNSGQVLCTECDQETIAKEEAKRKDTYVIVANRTDIQNGLEKVKYYYLTNDGFNFTLDNDEIWHMHSKARANTHIAKYFTSLKSGVYTDIKAVKYSDIK